VLGVTEHVLVRTAAVREALDLAGGAGALVEIRGVAGSGKSVLWRLLADQLDAAGRTVLVVRGGRVRYDEPFGAFVPCGDAPPSSPAACAEAVRRVVGDGGVVLVDDAHLLDDASRRVLVDLAESAAEGRLMLIVLRRPRAAQPDETDLMLDELVAADGHRIEVTDWTEPDVRQLGVSDPAAVVRRSGGLALFATRLAEGRDVAAVVRARIARMSEDARCALADGRAHAELWASGIADATGTPIPIVGEVLGADAPVDRRDPRSARAATCLLTDRECDIGRRVLDGLTHREIAAQLFLAPKTVEHHVARIRQRLGVSTRSALMAALRVQLTA
jgi:DNA-binding NarL/FixJ family response regulator